MGPTVLRPLRACGGPDDIGAALGGAARSVVHRVLRATPVWQHVTAPRHGPLVVRMAVATRELFPAVYAEISALADGLDLPVEQVLAWTARGDILADAGEGCTTVQKPGKVALLAHNEDGLPALAGECFMLDITPDDAPRFLSFGYPASIPGHSFALTSAGLVITVNNLRLTGIVPEIPRLVLTRALLSAPNRAAAVAILRDAPPSGGFHLSIAQAGEPDIWSVSFGGGEVIVSVRDTPAVHANHVLVEGRVLSRQVITRSSYDRQVRASAMLAQGCEPLVILRDTSGSGLPIFRDQPDDPDEENTLAQFVASVGSGAVDWEIHDPASARTVSAAPHPMYSGRMAIDRGAE